MGATGVRPFENDAAIDWLARAVTKDLGTAIDSAFRKLEPTLNRQPGATASAHAVAAAALLALAVKHNSKINALLKSLGTSITSVAAVSTPERLKAARNALVVVSSDRSRLDLEWEDSGLLKKWQSQLKAIDAVLAKADLEG